ncbi:MAG: hypothetical protein ABSF90_31050 [Syntrophobacteraceae bacterium]|jgi:hypothetical protein
MNDFTTHVHEAGHGVMAYLWQAGPVRIEPFNRGDDTYGVSFSNTGLHQDQINSGNPKDRQLVQKCILVAMAGPAAEYLFSGTAANFETDAEDALEQLRFIQPEATLSSLESYANTAQRILAEPRNWGAVMALAEALREKRKLTGDEAKEILRNSRQLAEPPFPPVEITIEQGR